MVFSSVYNNYNLLAANGSERACEEKNHLSIREKSLLQGRLVPMR